MKLNLQLAKREGTWLLWSPEAELPLAYEEELEDEDGQEILRLGAAVDAAAESPGALRPADPHGPELFVRGRPAGQRAELPGQARPQDKCSTVFGRRRLRATGPRRSEGSGTGSARWTGSITASSGSS